MRTLGRVLASVVLLLAVAAVGAWLYLQRSLPQLDGQVAVRGIAAAVEVVRDSEGVPHVFAASERDGWFAMGYLHAQDRLWQMELQRRLAQGRIAEILGERAYDTDRLMRTLGLALVAQRIVARLDAQTVGLLQAYADGVNAFLAADPVLPVEFHALRVKPAPWQPADSVAWLLVMSWDLSGNWRTELGRMRYAAKLGRERAAELIPPYPGDSAAPLPDFRQLYAGLDATAAGLIALSPGAEQAMGSNSWVVSGARSETGKPLLANDPHLGLQAPALWYLAHVQTPEGNVVGGTLPGLPFVVLGRNDHLAWSMTTTNSDTQDLYVEKLAPGDAESYMTPGGKARFDVRDEVIRVGSEERRIRVRSTRHGPVLSDALKPLAAAAPKGYVMALAWAALADDNASARAGFALNRARDRIALLAAVRDFHAPHQNIVFADREGHIGFVAPARVPVRRADNEAMGRLPVPGWLAKYDWQGFLPFDQLPALHDPASGRIVTANHKITPPGYRPFLSVDWFLPYRAERIEEMLAASPMHSLESFARMQGDTTSRLARELLPVALAAKPATGEGRAALALLAGWKADTPVDAAAPLVFAAWYRELTRLVYADELGDLFNESWEQRAGFMIPVMKAQQGYERWCDDVATPAKETCAMLAAKAFDRAAVDLRDRFGEARTWRWGSAHVAASDHRPFGFFPVVARLFNVAPATPGDSFSVNVGHYIVRDEARPFANKHAASLRALYDLADLDRSRFMQSTGQSGNVLSPWYDNFAARWARAEYITIPTARGRLAAPHVLKLTPTGS
ncbi:MAG TPA: penicillin acylase family protein [Usitatibacter sp.]|nr:penicillin acylase family protein [Usitatibacter sp.]